MPDAVAQHFAYPQTHVLSSSQASYEKSTGVITLKVPLNDVGNPSNGTRLYSTIAFSATSAIPQSATTLFNLTDATAPFEHVIGAPGTVGPGVGPGVGPCVGPGAGPGVGPGARSGGGTGSGNGRCAKATGRLSNHGLGRLSLGMARTRARRLYPRWSTRGRCYTDFYCATPIGIRVGYRLPGCCATSPTSCAYVSRARSC